jgi:heat shock factor-binding protein 1
LTNFVKNLLDQMNDKFKTLSDNIITRIDDMSERIDDLEKTVCKLVEESNMNEGYRNKEDD